MPPEHWQAQGINHLFGKSVLVHKNVSQCLSLPGADLYHSNPATGAQEQSLAPSSASPPHGAPQSSEVTLQPPLLQAQQPNCPQLPLTGHDFHPCHQLCALLQTFSRTSAPFLCSGAQNITQYPGWGCISTKCSPFWPESPSPCRLSYSQPLVSHRASSTASSQVQNMAFILLSFIPWLIALCSKVSRSPCQTSYPWKESSAPPTLVQPTNLLRVHLTPASKSLMEMFSF